MPAEHWDKLCNVLPERRIIPLADVAYIGLGEGAEAGVARRWCTCTVEGGPLSEESSGASSHRPAGKPRLGLHQCEQSAEPGRDVPRPLGRRQEGHWLGHTTTGSVVTQVNPQPHSSADRDRASIVVDPGAGT
jgi:hypothetical protein